MTDEQIRDALPWPEVFESEIEAYRLGVASERKHVMAVLAKMIDGDSPGDRAITEAMNQIERGDEK